MRIPLKKDLNYIKTKLLSTLIILAEVAVCVMLVPMQIQAADATNINSAPPSVTIDEETYYQLSSVDDIYWFAKQVNGGSTTINAILMHNIVINEDVLAKQDANDTASLRTWTPIGNSSTNRFSGIFDGNGYIISGLYLDDTENDLGLFRYSDGIIKNIVLVNSYFSFDGDGSVYVGGICARNSGSITNSFLEGVFSAYARDGDYAYANAVIGGICGRNSGLIESCQNKAEISARSYSRRDSAYTTTGGICGENNGGTITNCYNYGNIRSSASSGWYAVAYAGGICGENMNDGTISKCCNLMTVSAVGNGSTSDGVSVAYCGGVCGVSDGTVAYCFNTGDVNSETEASNHEDAGSLSCTGGVVGSNSGTVNRCNNIGTLVATSESGDAEEYKYSIANGSASSAGYNTAAFSNGTVCTALGYHCYKNGACDLCGVSCTDHQFKEAALVRTPNCSIYGIQYRICMACHFEETTSVDYDPTKHIYETTVVTPKCQEDGYILCTCACGDAKTEQIPATGHVWEESTCTVPKVCSACGKTEGEPRGHTYSSDYDVTCDLCGDTREITIANAILNVYRANVRLQELMKMGFYFTMDTDETVLEIGAIVWTEEEYASETAFDINFTNGTKHIATVHTNSDGSYYYSVETNGIPAQEIDMKLYIVPYVKTENGYAYGTVKSNSILNVCKYQYQYDTDEVKAIIADVLNYATAARNYFVAKGELEAPAEAFNAILSESDKELVWSEDLYAPRASVDETTSEYAPTAYQIYVYIQDALKIEFVFADTSVTGMMYWKGANYTDQDIHDGTTKTGEAAISTQGQYVVGAIEGINAYNIYEDYYIRGYNAKGELSKTYTTSIAAYLTYMIQSDSNPADDKALVELCKAMMVYGKNAMENNSVNKN